MESQFSKGRIFIFAESKWIFDKTKYVRFFKQNILLNYKVWANFFWKVCHDVKKFARASTIHLKRNILET